MLLRKLITLTEPILAIPCVHEVVNPTNWPDAKIGRTSSSISKDQEDYLATTYFCSNARARKAQGQPLTLTVCPRRFVSGLQGTVCSGGVRMRNQD